MTIRQILLAANTAAGGGGGVSSISLKGTATAATTSVSLPTHAAGDMLIIAASGSFVPKLPSGWTRITSTSVGTSPIRGLICAYKVAEDGSETSGTWTGATRIVAAVYDGVASIGSDARQSGTSTITYPGLTMSVSDGSSWVVGAGVFDSGSSATYAVPPTGMTYRNGGNGALGLHDTAAGASSWTAKSVWYGGIICAAITFELVSE